MHQFDDEEEACFFMRAECRIEENESDYRSQFGTVFGTQWHFRHGIGIF